MSNAIGLPGLQRLSVDGIDGITVFRMDGRQEGFIGGPEAGLVDFEDTEYLVGPGQLVTYQV